MKNIQDMQLGELYQAKGDLLTQVEILNSRIRIVNRYIASKINQSNAAQQTINNALKRRGGENESV